MTRLDGPEPPPAWAQRGVLHRPGEGPDPWTWHAITRAPSPAIARYELTHLDREPSNYPRAVAQHQAYNDLLRSLSISVIELPAEERFPGATFVEDSAVVLRELAILTRPGAESRRGEVTAIGAALSPFRPLASITSPGMLDGGDVLQYRMMLYVGLSSRTNAEGVKQLARLSKPHGYTVRTMDLRGCLHLKTAVTAATPSHVLLNPDWCDRSAFDRTTIIEVDPSEPFAANLLRLQDGVIMSSSFPRTAERIRAQGITVHQVDLSELAKAEGAVTGCSLLFPA